MRCTAAGLALVGLIVLGCGGRTDGPPLAAVSGVVTLDGKGVEGATVTFISKGKGVMSSALTTAEGRFTLKSATGRNGAVVGDHDVLVSLVVNLEQTGAAVSADGLAPPTAAETGASAPDAVEKPTVRHLIPENYSKPGALTATVPSGGLRDHKFDLKSQ